MCVDGRGGPGEFALSEKIDAWRLTDVLLFVVCLFHLSALFTRYRGTSTPWMAAVA